MRKVTIVSLLITGTWAFCGGCNTPGGTGPVIEGQTPPATPMKETYTAQNNPTTTADRGAPDLIDPQRPAAWIRIDGEEGHYDQRDGRDELQWVIDRPVSQAPTFRVDVYEPLLGSPRDIQLILQPRGASGGAATFYVIRANAGAFEVGKEYSLLKPGRGFTVADQTNDTVLDQIPPLAPGPYHLVAGIRDTARDRAGVAVTFFTVGDGG